MKIILIYISPNKTTQKISNELARNFSLLGLEVSELNIGKGSNRDFDSIDWNQFNGADIIGIGSPVYHMTLLEPMVEFLKNALPEISKRAPGITAFVYITYAGITSGKALLNTLTLLGKSNIGLTGASKFKAPHFWHIENYPDNDAKEMALRFCESLHQKNFRKMDIKKAHALFNRQKLMIKLLYPFVNHIGKNRNQPIEIKKKLCIKCKRCALECPVNAIKMGEYPERNAEKCIYCYHCTTVCTKCAVNCDVSKVQAIVKRNIKIVGSEQPANEVFY